MTSKYMNFTRLVIEGRKTPIISVTSRSSGDHLGRIEWYAPWRQYVFAPLSMTVFSAGCMTDIQAVIAQLKAESK